MTTIDLTSLEKAIRQLTDGAQTIARDPQNELMRDGVIQRFEYTMDLAWKFMQRYLKDVFLLNQVDDIPGKKDIFREAAKRGLIKNAETWFVYYNARNQTSHDYDPEKAAFVFEQALAFLPDVKILLEKLKDVNRRQT